MKTFKNQPRRKLLNMQLYKITSTIKDNHSISKWIYLRVLTKQVVILYTQSQAGKKLEFKNLTVLAPKIIRNPRRV